MNTSRVWFSSAMLLVACGGAEPSTTTTPTNAVEPAPQTLAQITPPAPETAAAPIAPPVATPTEERVAPAALVKPKSKWTVGGMSLSEIDATKFGLAAEKAGWTNSSGSGRAVGGQYESINFPLEKGKMKAEVKLVRPATTPNTSNALVPPADLASGMNKATSAWTYDADSDVFVGVEVTEGGKASDAKKILSAITKYVK